MGWSFSVPLEFQHRGHSTKVHADGNNVAWVCPCGHPVLFVYQQGRRGSSSACPTICQGCHTSYSLSPAYSSPEPPRGQPQAPAAVVSIVGT
jgi:hypothetical protein